MASSPRPRRSQRRLKKTPPKKRRAGVAAGKPRKAATNKAATKKAAGKTSGKTVAPGIVETVLATFAHEVRTPLTGILAISDLLATSDLDERERRWVDTIKAGAEHLASLATLFVDAAKTATTGLTPKNPSPARMAMNSVTSVRKLPTMRSIIENQPQNGPKRSKISSACPR